ncbi:trans-sialidase, putative, partial [Trypanosoma cruzi marinkellei]
MVSIDGVPTKGGPIPVMGVRAGSEGENKLMELSHNKEKNWQVLCGDETLKLDSSTLGAEKTQHVVILVRNGNQGSAYVDGQRVGEDPRCALGNTESKMVSHFYIGGDGGSTDSTDGAGSRDGVSVTVTNVLLYNRPLTSAEITALKANKASILPSVDTTIEGTAFHSSGGRQQAGQGQS